MKTILTLLFLAVASVTAFAWTGNQAPLGTIAVTAPVTGNGTTGSPVAMPAATTGVNGYSTSTQVLAQSAATTNVSTHHTTLGNHTSTLSAHTTNISTHHSTLGSHTSTLGSHTSALNNIQTITAGIRFGGDTWTDAPVHTVTLASAATTTTYSLVYSLVNSSGDTGLTSSTISAKRTTSFDLTGDTTPTAGTAINYHIYGAQ